MDFFRPVLGKGCAKNQKSYEGDKYSFHNIVIFESKLTNNHYNMKISHLLVFTLLASISSCYKESPTIGIITAYDNEG